MAQGSSAALICEPITTLGPLAPPPRRGLVFQLSLTNPGRRFHSLDPSASNSPPTLVPAPQTHTVPSNPDHLNSQATDLTWPPSLPGLLSWRLGWGRGW